MSSSKLYVRRVPWMLFAGAVALLSAVLILLLLSQSRVLAKPSAEAAALEISKEVSASEAAPGETLLYTVTVGSSVPDPFVQALLTDPLPVELVFVPGTLNATLGEAVEADGVITWSYYLEPGNEALITFQAEISSELIYADIVNTAQLTGTGELMEASASTAAFAPMGNLDNSMTEKSASADKARPGDLLVYEIFIKNDEQEIVYGAEFTDPLPPEVTYVPGTLGAIWGDVDFVDNAVTWAYTVPKGSGDVISFTVQISPDLPYDRWITNTVEIASPGKAFTRAARTYVSRPAVWLPIAYRFYPPSTVLNPIPEADADHKFTVLWQDPGVDVDHYTLQMGNNEWFEHIKKSWTPTGVSQLVYSYCDYYFRVRAENPGAWGHGTWSNVERGHKSAPAPTLNPISVPEGGDLTLTWSAIPSLDGWDGVDRYVVQESDDEGFGTVTRQWDAFSPSLVVPEPSGGTWYYRLRADDGDCWGEGPWSNTESVTFGAFEYFDDFSDRNSGWPREWSKTRGALYEIAPYEHPKCPGSECPYDGDGYTIARRSGSEPKARFGPGVAVPSANYELELDSRWFDAKYFATYQIFFGADSALEDYYAVQVRINDATDPDICEYSVVKHTADSAAVTPYLAGRYVVDDVASTKWMQPWSQSDSLRCGIRNQNSGDKGWNHWVIRRDGSEITVWLNGTWLGTWTDGGFGADRYFGVGATLYEGFTPSKPEFDNWSVVLLD